MKLHAFDAEVAALEDAVSCGTGAPAPGAPPEAVAALAWHLRQRDAARARALAGPLRARDDVPLALRARAALAFAEASGLLCHPGEAEAALAQARHWLERGIDAVAEGDAHLVEAALAKALGQRERMLSALDTAVDAYRRRHQPDREDVARAMAGFEAAYAAIDVDAADEPITPGPRFPEADCACDAIWSATRAFALSRRDPRACIALYQHAGQQARQVGLVRLEVVSAVNAGAALQGLADHDRAAHCFDRAHAMARRAGWPELIGVTQTKLGALLCELGAHAESRAMLEDAIRVLSVAPHGISMANACFALGQSLLEAGGAVEALAPMEEGLRLYRVGPYIDHLTLTLLFLGRALSRAGRPVEALEALGEAQGFIDTYGLGAMRAGVHAMLAEVYRRHPEAAAAGALPPGARAPDAVIHHAEAALDEGRRVPGWKAPAWLLEFLADAWSQAGDPAAAYRFAKEALVAKEAETRQRLTYPIALLRLRGGATRLEGESVAASNAREAAAASGDALPLPAVPPRPSVRSITPKERMILQLLARNYSNKEIAQSIAVSEETVKWHLKNLFGKLDAGSRKHAVTRARTLGFIELSS
jgi:DNA-binding CsgD family transcriptional regulator